VTDRLVIVGSDASPQAHLYALERATGTVRWKHAFAGGVGAQVLQKGNTALALSAAGEVVAVDIESGRIVWRTPPLEATEDRSLDPVLAGDRLLVGRRSGGVEALDATTGRTIWRTQLGERLNTSLVVAGTSVVVGSLDGRVYRLSQEDGSVLAQLVLKGLPYGDLVLSGGCLLSLSLEASSSQEGPAALSCLDPSLATTRWSFRSQGEISTFRPLVYKDRAVVGWNGTLIGLDLVSGAEAWSCPLKGVPRGLGFSGDVLYVGTLSGSIHALPAAKCAAASPR
jgi:outer membrane protein assembly factor BamB